MKKGSRGMGGGYQRGELGRVEKSRKSWGSKWLRAEDKKGFFHGINERFSQAERIGTEMKTYQ